MSEALSPYRVRAHNSATASENKIHDDTVARRYGFAGGLVPGVTVYGYMTRPAAEAFGRAWIERGTMAARFVTPVYEGDDVTVEATRTEDGMGEVLELAARRPDGTIAGTGRATLPRVAAEPPDLAGYPKAMLPADRPPVSREALEAITVLGSIEGTFHADKAPAFLEELGDDLALYRDEGVAHPGYLILTANYMLSQNVRLAPWIHVESETTHFRAVEDGDKVSVRGRVARLFEAKGHKFVELDLLWVANDAKPVQRTRHTAIYDIRQQR